PEVYIIGGGLGEALGKPLLERVSKRMIEYSELYRRQRPRLVMAKLGDGAVAIGAAVAAGMAKR
ncbi:MAG: ROK family protein, partial [Planctomycetota bacterium]